MDMKIDSGILPKKHLLEELSIKLGKLAEKMKVGQSVYFEWTGPNTDVKHPRLQARELASIIRKQGSVATWEDEFTDNTKEHIGYRVWKLEKKVKKEKKS